MLYAWNLIACTNLSAFHRSFSPVRTDGDTGAATHKQVQLEPIRRGLGPQILRPYLNETGAPGEYLREVLSLAESSGRIYVPSFPITSTADSHEKCNNLTLCHHNYFVRFYGGP